MITRLKNMDDLIPVFRTYLGYMSRFYTLHDVDAWCDTAVKNMQQFVQTDEQKVYVIRPFDAIIGFAQVNRHLRFNNKGWAMAEFYIHKDYEKKGYGAKLAEYVFDQSCGHWEIAISPENKNARRFWRQVINTYTSGDFKEKNRHGFLFEKK